MLNTSFSQTITVEQNQTAKHLGSGTLPVFATPAMIALMENTAMKCLNHLSDSDTSVGIAISTNHLKASQVGSKIHCTATITGIEGRKYEFQIKVTDDDNNLIGEGNHQRVVVNIDKFMSKL